MEEKDLIMSFQDLTAQIELCKYFSLFVLCHLIIPLPRPGSGFSLLIFFSLVIFIAVSQNVLSLILVPSLLSRVLPPLFGLG